MKDYELLVVLSLDRSDAVQCMARTDQGGACGRIVYAQVHVLGFPDGRIEFWGCTCFSVLAETCQRNPNERARFFCDGLGRRLTCEERALLRKNAMALMALFEGERQRLVREAQEHQSLKNSLLEKEQEHAGGPEEKAVDEVAGHLEREAAREKDYMEHWNLRSAAINAEKVRVERARVIRFYCPEGEPPPSFLQNLLKNVDARPVA